MPAGDPAGYLPNVRKARKAKGESEYQPRSKQKLTQSTPGGGRSPRPHFEHDPKMQRPRPKGKADAGTVTFPGRGRMARKGIDPKYQHSSFNPFGSSPSPGGRIKRGADNHPNEGDSDYEGPRARSAPYKGRKRG